MLTVERPAFRSVFTGSHGPGWDPAADPLVAPFMATVENRMAVAAVDRLDRLDDDDDGRLVVLHGPPGVGKSHLVAQYADRERRNPAGRRVESLTASQLAADLGEAIDSRTYDRFEARLFEADVLVVEDLQAIEGRRPVQAFLIGWLDETLGRGGRVVLTTTKSPGELDRCDTRLINRCHGGVCVGLGLPGTTSRAALLEHFAKLRGLAVPADQTQRLAERLSVSPRELAGAVARLDVLAADLGRTVVNGAIVDRFFAEEVDRRPLDIAQIARATANHFGLSVSHLRTGGRHAATVLPRQLAMYLARELTGEPLEKIALYFGRKNHGTVIHAARRAAARVEEDAAVRRHVAAVRRALGMSAQRATVG